jgi:hypothetical protein
MGLAALPVPERCVEVKGKALTILRLEAKSDE